MFAPLLFALIALLEGPFASATVNPRSGFAPLKVTVTAHFDDRLRGHDYTGCIVIEDYTSSCFPIDQPSTQVTRTFTIQDEGEWGVYVVVGNFVTPRIVVQVR